MDCDLDMLPRATRPNCLDIRAGCPECPGNLTQRPKITADGQYLFGGQYTERFPAIDAAMPNLVFLVVALGIPPKILDAIVRSAAVIVATLAPWRRRTCECKQDQPVNQEAPSDAEAGQISIQMPGLVGGRFENAPGRYSPDSPVIRSLVQSFEARNRFPMFHHAFPYTVV